MCRIWNSKRLVFGHLGAYVLGSIIDEGEECAVAIQSVHSMLDERVERNDGAGDGVWRRAFCDVEGERGSREISRAASQHYGASMHAFQLSYAAISYARTRSWLSIAAGDGVHTAGSTMGKLI